MSTDSEEYSSEEDDLFFEKISSEANSPAFETLTVLGSGSIEKRKHGNYHKPKTRSFCFYNS